MAPRIKSILKPPEQHIIVRPSAEVIRGYLKALEEDCNRILKEEGLLTNNDNLTQIIIERQAKGALQ